MICTVSIVLGENVTAINIVVLKTHKYFECNGNQQLLRYVVYSSKVIIPIQ